MADIGIYWQNENDHLRIFSKFDENFILLKFYSFTTYDKF